MCRIVCRGKNVVCRGVNGRNSAVVSYDIAGPERFTGSKCNLTIEAIA